ncbi:MAG TPA: hypothetical protein VFE07_11365, partial [Marmoricola sp.]|nr:hypothetical protein [Marmoricola sp.]
VAVHFHGRGHTDGDVVVEVLGSGVTFAGDLIRQDRAPWYGDAFPLQWPATVAHMLVLGVDAHTWVPGHGRPMSTREVRVQAAELDEVAQVVTEAWYAGVDEAEAAAELELGPENSRHAATRGYAELAAGHVDRVPST